jgi:hypothetical protein
MARQHHRQMLREQPVIAQNQDALFRVFREQLRPGDQQHGLARAGQAIDDAMTIPQGTRITLLAQVGGLISGSLSMGNASARYDLGKPIQSGFRPLEPPLRVITKAHAAARPDHRCGAAASGMPSDVPMSFM